MADIAKAGLTRTEGTKPASSKPALSQKAGSRPDVATIGGIVLALGGIVGGLLMEGGMLRLIHVLLDKTQLPDAAIEELIGYATQARRIWISPA
jgi:hypothetical protein